MNCTVAAEDDILIGRLAADLRGATRVDLSICNEHGVEQVRLQDIPVRSDAGGVISQEVVYQESITFMKAAPTGKVLARLVAFDETCGHRLIGEYTFNHTRMSSDEKCGLAVLAASDGDQAEEADAE